MSDSMTGIMDGRQAPFINGPPADIVLRGLATTPTQTGQTEALMWAGDMIDPAVLQPNFNFAIQVGGFQYDEDGNDKPVYNVYWQDATEALDPAPDYGTLLLTFTSAADTPDSNTTPQPLHLDIRGRVLNAGAGGEIVASGIMSYVTTVSGGVVSQVGAATAEAGVTVDLSKAGRFIITADCDGDGSKSGFYSVIASGSKK